MQNNTYITTVATNTAANSNTFTSLRALSVSGNYSYTIPLDRNINMIYAFLNDGNAALHFHENNYGFFNIKLDSQTGSCTTLHR